MLLDVGVEIVIFHVGEEVEVVAIPEEPGGRLRLRGPGLGAEPGEPEPIDDLGVLPRGIGPLAGDRDRLIGETALERGRGGG